MKLLFICHSITEYEHQKDIQLNVFDHTGAISEGVITLHCAKSVNEFKVGECYEISSKFKKSR